MTNLDTSAYTPAHETEPEQGEKEDLPDPERTRFQIPLDQERETNLIKAVKNLEQMVRDDSTLQMEINRIKTLITTFDSRKFLKMYRYECDKCGEIFDTKKSIGEHHSMKPNCDGGQPWDLEEPSYTKRRVQNED